MSHCHRGDEYIVGQRRAHLPLRRRRRGGAGQRAAAAAGQPADGTPGAGRHRGRHQARRRALRAHPPAGAGEHPRRQGAAVAYLAEATALARRRGLATHLDGARLFNAAVAMRRRCAGQCRDDRRATSTACRCASARGWARRSARRWWARSDLIARAHRWRKMLGGGMRQAGVLAAAALHALDHHVDAPGRRPCAGARAWPRACSGIDGLDGGAAADQHRVRRRARRPRRRTCWRT